jgi:Bacterial Ig-like domain (group 3)/Carboxypeptidase regulatory-like domain
MLARLVVLGLVIGLGLVTAPFPASADPYGLITGTVTGPGGLPASTIDVRMMHRDASGSWTTVGTGSTDADGHFELWAQPGTHRLAFYPYLETSVYEPTFYPDASTIELASDITVTSDSSHDFAVQLNTGPHAELAGTVVGTDGAPVSGAEVQFWTDQGTAESPWWVNRFLVKTDAAGHFQELIKPGTYRISYRRAGFEEVFHGGSVTVETASDVTLEEGGTAQLNAVMTKETLIRGSVRAAGRGVAIPGTRVNFYRNLGTAESPAWSLESSAEPNWDTGAFAKRVAPGDYLIRAVDPYGEYLSEYFDRSLSTATATTVSMTRESTLVGINFNMTRVDAPAIGSISPPVVTGTARVGETINASAGVWSPDPTSVTYQWFADGVAITGATNPTYQPVSADLGHTLTVRTRAYTPGRYPAYQASAETPPVEPALVVPPAKVPSTTTARVSQTGTTVKLTVTVKAATPVQGKVQILRKARLLQTVRLLEGKATITLRDQPRGTWRYKAAYLGSRTVLPSHKTVRVVV